MIDFFEAKDRSDIETIAELAEKIWRDHFTPIIGEYQVTYMLKRFQSVEAIKKQFETEDYRYFIAIEDSRPLGYCGMKDEKNGYLFLSKFYMDKNERGRGVGGKLLKFSIEQFSPNPETLVYLTVNKYNDSTIAIYKHLGFEIVSEMVTNIGENFVMDDYRLECPVNKLLK